MSGTILKNYAVALTSPTAWIGLFLILGLVFIWTQKQRLAKWSITIGAGLFLLFAFDPFTEILLNSFENKYEGFKIKTLTQAEKIKHIVVLAGGYVPNHSIHPLTSALTKHTLARVIEGIKIHKEIPGSILVFTGKGWAEQTEASAMRELALKLGVNSDQVILEEESCNTFEHTIHLKKLLSDQSFVLVTSAMHMPRAMGLFLKAGYKPIPAPTSHILLGEYALFNMKVPFAAGSNLEAIDFWFNEFVAINWAKLNGRI